MRRFVPLLCLLLAPIPAVAEIVWTSGFETGDRSEWSSTQMVDVSRLLVVRDLEDGAKPREGARALKATVIQGDKPIIASGNRNELVKMTLEATGSEYWYGWSVRFAKDFPSEKTWQLFTQWHHTGNNGSPPVEFYVYGEEIRLNIGGNPGRIVWRTPLKRGVWLDFVMRVRWSPDPKVGLVELYLGGKQVLPPLSISTQFRDEKGAVMKNYLKAGLYRNDTISKKGTLYLDRFMIATRQADVMPVPAPPPTTPTDAGTKGLVDAGSASKADAGVAVKVDAGTPPPADAGMPRVEAGTPAKAVDAGVLVTDDAALPGTPGAVTAPMDADTKTQAGGLSGDAGTAPSPPPKGGVTAPPKKDGGCSAGGGDLLIPGALFTLAALRFGSYRLRPEA